MLKEEIKPHQKNSNQVAEAIRQKIKEARKKRKGEQSKQKERESVIDNILKEKKCSRSAYITARKKIFEKQSSIGANSISESQFAQFQEQHKYKNIEMYISRERQIPELKPTSLQP